MCSSSVKSGGPGLKAHNVSNVKSSAIEKASLQLLDGGSVQLLVHNGRLLGCALNRHVSAVGVGGFFAYSLPILDPRMEMSWHLWPFDREYLSRQRPLLPVSYCPVWDERKRSYP